MAETYDGDPCRRCNNTLRYVKRKACVDCARRRAVGYKLQDDRALEFLFKRARWRAGRDGIPFELDLSDLTMPDVCPVLGIPMDKPSLDRDDNSKGYTKDNVVVMSWRANHLKNDGVLEEFEKLTAYLRNRK